MLPRHVYVHVPFCARRCAYCDFAIAVRPRVPVDDYLRALNAEVLLRYPGNDHWDVDTLYFGGGTPSLLGAEGVGRMVGQLRARLALAEGAEVTLEANPDDVTRDAAAAWRDAGVNRLSIGAQSFDQGALEWMHRLHSAEQIASAVEAARSAGIGNISLDLIFALPESLERDWERDVQHALALAPDHLSLYGLTIEPSTPLGRWRDRGAAIEAPEERYESDFMRAHSALTAGGLEHYEVSNFGRPGFRSRHNSSYWAGVPYAGLGPGAHEFDGRRRRWNEGAYAAWHRRLVNGETSISGEEELTEANRTVEDVYLGLRTTAGLLVDSSELAHTQPWVDAGWADLEGGRLRLRPEGWLRLDALAANLAEERCRRLQPG